MESNQPFNVFISCSLREQDKSFIEFVSKILSRFGFIPFSTVGKYDAAPMYPAEHMRLNIPKADIVVIVATPRYEQHDIHTEQTTRGLPEMIHVEAGMAFMSEKPVIVFAQEGTHVGKFSAEYYRIHNTRWNRPGQG